MATPEALIKYYDCLKDSFSKIQDKDNETALINAALRPKIREEFAKNQDVLTSYLNYIQVFTIIYNDKFSSICSNIVVPLLKEHDVDFSSLAEFVDEDESVKDEFKKEKDIALQIHRAIRAILRSRKDLACDFVSSLSKAFPNSIDDNSDESFEKLVKNSLACCTYLKSDQLNILVAKILDKINPPQSPANSKDIQLESMDKTLAKSYQHIYEFIENINRKVRKRFIKAFLKAFTRDFITIQSTNNQLHLMILYFCSKKTHHVDHLLESLWDNFIDTSKSYHERIMSINYANSFISRANYVDIDKMMDYLQRETQWCFNFLDERRQSAKSEESIDFFYALAQSMFYMLSQRYREMYEEETINKVKELDIKKLILDPTKPLENCISDVRERFQEIASLYNLADPEMILSTISSNKKIKLDSIPEHHKLWKLPYRESCDSLPKNIIPLYRNYYDHRNFTVYRE